MKTTYLTHGANSLKGILRSGYKYDKKSIKIFLVIACETLSILLDDEETLKIISSPREPHYELENNQRNKDLRSFIRQFVIVDRAIMISSGMDRQVAHYLFEDMWNLQKILESKDTYNINYLRNRIEELKYTACGEVENTNKLASEIILKKALNVIGGGAIVVANASAGLILTPQFSSLSQAYGGHLIGKGIEGLKD